MNKDKQVERIARKILFSMAYKRSEFKNKVEECVNGAMLEYFKATIALGMGQIEWTQHWLTEVRNLIDYKLMSVVRHEIRGFTDRQKAVNEVVNKFIDYDERKIDGFIRSAAMIIKNDFKLDTKVQDLAKLVNKTHKQRFWERVNKSVETGLA